MPQLQINQGPQDALLYDNTRSYFTNVGYVRTSNFQVELRDVEPVNNAELGSQVQFVIPKAADLLGPLDLIVEFNAPSSLNVASGYAAWVENIGYAMLEKVIFSVGSTDVETITGDQLNIINELMRSETQRLDKTIGKTGRGACSYQPNHLAVAGSAHVFFDTPGASVPHGGTEFTDGRAIAINDAAYSTAADTKRYKKKVVVPLGLFFTKHPSQYFPLAAIAGCNDVRVTVKFRNMSELIIVGNSAVACSLLDDVAVAGSVSAGDPGTATNPVTTIDVAASPTAVTMANLTWPNKKIESCHLRAHYVHVTGPEATTLMNKEHVRLMKLWQNNGAFTKKVTGKSTATSNKVNGSFNIDLSFLHPIQEFIITIRKTTELSSADSGEVAPNALDQKALGKNRFAYHGNGTDPNIESMANRCSAGDGAILSTAVGSDSAAKLQSYQSKPPGVFSADLSTPTLKVNGFKLTLNGQERHPSLNKGIERDYLMDRLMPMLHSNTATNYEAISRGSLVDGSELDFAHLQQLKDRKEIYVYPFALNPEGPNPSGAVNFSKVSHARLTIEYDSVGVYGGEEVEFQVDVYGVYYNWLQIKDGRALLSFA